MNYMFSDFFLDMQDISAMSVASDPRRQRVEMTVETESGKSYEFGQIPKEELEPLQRFTVRPPTYLSISVSRATAHSSTRSRDSFKGISTCHPSFS